MVYSQNLKPYILAIETSESITEIKEKIISNLEKQSIEIVGQYQPAADKNRYIIVFTSNELEKAIVKIGGLTGFASALRIGITIEGGKTKVSYTNPQYWGNAYFQSNYEKVSSHYAILSSQLANAMKASGTYLAKPFGSKEGISPKDLREYHYMMGMPYFEDTEKLAEFDSYNVANSKIQASIKKTVPNVKLVYKVTIPGKELTLYGFALSGVTGEEKFLPTIDIGSPKHTAFLPYEILVKGKEVLMLHGRYRIALSFPDLTMGTFSKIMSTPGNIEDLLKQLVK
jgi:hypothetical protein